jgi:hypothetical protein
MLLEEQRESAVAPERHPRRRLPQMRGRLRYLGRTKEDHRSRRAIGATVIDPLWM